MINYTLLRNLDVGDPFMFLIDVLHWPDLPDRHVKNVENIYPLPKDTRTDLYTGNTKVVPLCNVWGVLHQQAEANVVYTRKRFVPHVRRCDLGHRDVLKMGGRSTFR